MPKVNFSKHACRQLGKRSILPIEEVENILKYNLYIPIGIEKGKKRNDKIHKLFWSNQDIAWFVIIQDDFTGTVITILPPDRSCWAVSNSTLNQARDLVVGKIKPY